MPRVYALDYAALLSADTGGALLADQADFLLPEEGAASGVGARRGAAGAALGGAAGVAGWPDVERRAAAGSTVAGRARALGRAAPRHARPGRDRRRLARGTGLLLRARGLGVWGRTWALRRAYYDVLPARGTDALGTFGLGTPEAATASRRS